MTDLEALKENALKYKVKATILMNGNEIPGVLTIDNESGPFGGMTWCFHAMPFDLNKGIDRDIEISSRSVKSWRAVLSELLDHGICPDSPFQIAEREIELIKLKSATAAAKSESNAAERPDQPNG